MNRLIQSSALICHHDANTDIETEAQVEVFYYIQPAEPDVGISSRYVEVEYYACPTPLGLILFTPTEFYEEVIAEQIGQELYDHWED